MTKQMLGKQLADRDWCARELEERDAMIAGLHLSSVTSSANGSPCVRSPQHGSPGTNQAPLRRPQVQT